MPPQTEEQASTVESWQEVMNDLIVAAVDVLNKGVIPPENLTGADPKIVSVLLLARTLSNTKGVRVLLQKGRVLEARILVRNCLENGFWLARLIEDGSAFVHQMIEDEQKRRAMRGQLLFDTQVQLEAAVEQRLRDWMKERRHWKDSKTLDPKGVAKGGSISDAYLFYSELSVDAHPGLEALNRYAARTDESDLEFEPEVNWNEYIDTLHLACFSTLTVLVGVDQMLGYGATEQLQLLTERFQTLEAGQRQ
jgi:hypothetical protein